MALGTSLGTAFLAAGAALPAAAPLSRADAREVVARQDLTRYCQGRVAEKFHVSRRDILTRSAERRDDGWVVSGQHPRSGRDVTTFECHFGANGQWKRAVLADGPPPRRDDERGEVVAERDMGRCCDGMAAEAFDQRPQEILTLAVERDPGGYVVYGQFPPEGRHVTTFECHYNARGVFKTVYRS